MAGFTERIRLVFDVDNKGAQTGFAGFRKSVTEAQGFAGKFKAGVGSLSASLKENMAPAALAAAAALVTFGVKAVQAFTSTAKAAIDLGAATGLSTEQASRWIAVGEDMGVTAEQLTQGIGRIAKTLDSAKWADYGISTRDAAGHVRDANDVMLDAFDLLSRTPSATERARIGNDLFGKGYANLAPLIGKSRAEMEKYLSSVEDGQVITDKEGKKAEKMRLAWDKLSDALGEFALATGEALTNLAPLIDGLGELVGVLEPLTSAIGSTSESVNKIDFTDPINGSHEVVNSLKEQVRAWIALQAPPTAAEEAIRRETEQAVIAAKTHRTLAEAIDAARRKWDTFTEHLDDENAFANAILSLEGLREKLADIAASDSTDAEKWAEMTLAINGTTGEITSTLEQLGIMSDVLAQRFEILVETDQLEHAARLLEILARAAPALKSGEWFGSNVGRSSSTAGVRGFASGTRSAPAGLALVGENGPELVNLRGGESILPAGQTAAALGGGTNVTINVSVAPGANLAEAGRQTADALAAFYRNGGQRP